MEKEIKSWVIKANESVNNSFKVIYEKEEKHEDDSDLTVLRLEHEKFKEMGMDASEEFMQGYDLQCSQFARVFRWAVNKYYEDLAKDLKNKGYTPTDMRIIWMESNRDSMVGIQDNMNLIIMVQNTDYGFTITVMSNAE